MLHGDPLAGLPWYWKAAVIATFGATMAVSDAKDKIVAAGKAIGRTAKKIVRKAK